MYGSNTVAISATTSGVTGTIACVTGAHLRNLSLGFTESANAADVVTIIELSWASAPTPLRFTPNEWGQAIGTPAAGGQVNIVSDENVMIPLDVVMEKDNTLTIKVTSTGNLAVKIGVEWD